jgi:hypothetical protein
MRFKNYDVVCNNNILIGNEFENTRIIAKNKLAEFIKYNIRRALKPSNKLHFEGFIS